MGGERWVNDGERLNGTRNVIFLFNVRDIFMLLHSRVYVMYNKFYVFYVTRNRGSITYVTFAEHNIISTLFSSTM